jgi:hypothetical protein
MEWQDDGEQRDGDDYGQVDGDSSGRANFVPFVPNSAGQPWLRSAQPPWHMWGNTQNQSVLPLGGGATPLVATSNQLCRVAYGRPESWNWLFSAKLVSGPDTLAVGQHVTLTVHWDLIVGIGRAMIALPDFDVFSFNWNDGDPFPFGRQIWSTHTLSPAKAFVAGSPAAATSVVSSFTGQDIQLTARCFLQELSLPAIVPVVVELSGQFSPLNHIRADWYREKVPEEVKFAGAEVPGR